MSELLIVLLGFGTVFVGLVCLIFIVKLYSFVCQRLTKGKKKAKPEAAAEAVVEQGEDRQQLIAAVAAAVATVMGKDTQGIRILSFKKVGGNQ